jgi:uncharacterized protein (TIGR02145 family)
MTVLITLTVAGADTGPFNLFSNTDGFVSAFATNVPKASLLAGYSSSAVPNFTTTVRLVSLGDCTNFIDIVLDAPTTTTTSSSSSSTSTTSTTSTTNPCPNCTPHDVTIGLQIWSACNLDVTTYRNGDTIPQVSDPTAWAALTTGAWCYYNNDPANGARFGKLYNWYAVNDPRGLAPVGYHIPTDAEVTTLTTYLGGITVAGGAMKEAGECNWLPPNVGATNSSGFTALPGGGRYDSGSFVTFLDFGFWWTSSEASPTTAWFRNLNYINTNVYRNNIVKEQGQSVRLIKD